MKSKLEIDKLGLFLLFALLGFILIVNFHLKAIELSKNYSISGTIVRSGPVYTRGIYLSSWSAGTRLKEFVELAEKTKLNTFIIDIKDSYGKVAYSSAVPLVKKLNLAEQKIKNINGLTAALRQKGIYTIARIPIFQDKELAQKAPHLALKDKRTGKIWQDFKGLSWVDPISEEVWNYNLELAKELFKAGFDEVNFDYVRFPSDGRIDNIGYPFFDGRPKYEVLRDFFAFLNKELRDLGYISVDLFGLTFWHTQDNFDLNIGQRLVDALEYFDYICPMVYPSHYAKGFEGYENPAEYPYEVIYKNLVRAKQTLGPDSLSKIRPWLQDFSFGAEYTPDMVKLEKKAVYDADAYGWILWNAKNNYTEEALDRN